MLQKLCFSLKHIEDAFISFCLDAETQALLSNLEVSFSQVIALSMKFLLQVEYGPKLLKI